MYLVLLGTNYHKFSHNYARFACSIFLFNFLQIFCIPNICTTNNYYYTPLIYIADWTIEHSISISKYCKTKGKNWSMNFNTVPIWFRSHTNICVPFKNIKIKYFHLIWNISILWPIRTYNIGRSVVGFYMAPNCRLYPKYTSIVY